MLTSPRQNVPQNANFWQNGRKEKSLRLPMEDSKATLQNCINMDPADAVDLRQELPIPEPHLLPNKPKKAEGTQFPTAFIFDFSLF
jgi:hypothetical protein